MDKSKLLSAINSRALAFIVLSGIAGALSWLAYFFALKTGPASAVAALDRLSVVFVLILATLSERDLKLEIGHWSGFDHSGRDTYDHKIIPTCPVRVLVSNGAGQNLNNCLSVLFLTQI